MNLRKATAFEIKLSVFLTTDSRLAEFVSVWKDRVRNHYERTKRHKYNLTIIGRKIPAMCPVRSNGSWKYHRERRIEKRRFGRFA